MDHLYWAGKGDTIMGMYCRVFKHDYKLVQVLNAHSRRIQCSRCKKSFLMNDHTKLVIKWDKKIHNMYKDLGVKVRYLPGETPPLD